MDSTRRLLAITLAVGLMALAARVTVPMVPVPMTLQTLAVLVAGGILGSWAGAASVGAYLLLAGVGLPLFADGEAGWEHLRGPTAGYLFGFLPAALIVGSPRARKLARASVLYACVPAAAGHLAILVLGVAWLSTHVGWEVALERGLVPFLAGAAVKSIVAGAGVHFVLRARTGRA